MSPEAHSSGHLNRRKVSFLGKRVLRVRPSFSACVRKVRLSGRVAKRWDPQNADLGEEPPLDFLCGSAQHSRGSRNLTKSDQES
ncbi:hypothetical protein NHX12_030080 [Muraenolepis orangiensis]|uniref:Uncharacterized protein n=1 Tax=Muraenolepis orangiensis TaxID=630683 RepID=A0A9Q0IMF7_9TELE|nr:hypothetical protein NHX12_030080 [Muraenolepis orangiensis]